MQFTVGKFRENVTQPQSLVGTDFAYRFKNVVILSDRYTNKHHLSPTYERSVTALETADQP